MPPRIPDRKRAKILKDIQTHAGSCRAIAAKHGVSTDTVRNIAKNAGITDAFGREQTKKATEARQADHHARLIQLASRMAGLSERVLASFEAMDLDAWTKVSPHSRGIILGIAADKARDLGPRDDQGADSVGSLLGGMLDDLIARHGDSPAE